MDLFYNRINDYDSATIRLASPEDIHSQSYGEVKNTETINYRTFRPEKDGLFCQRIFGPEKDWECFCGKYKGIKYKGLVCDRCGVEITLSRARRKRMGHVDLAAPVVHYWFFKTIPSRLGNILGMKNSDLQRIIYYQDYVVTSSENEEIAKRDPEAAKKLQRQKLLSEKEYNHYNERFRDEFEAQMGAEAIRTLLDTMDFELKIEQLREELNQTGSKQTIKRITNRLRILQQLDQSENDPTWMILDVLPIIPPDLRPLVSLDSGNFATSDLNDLYRRMISRNNRLKHLQDLNAPEVILRNEKRMLQQSVDAIFDNGSLKRPQTGSDNRPLKSLTDMIKGKQGRFRRNLLGKRVDYSARSVIVAGTDLKLDECGLPKKIALELYEPFIVRKLREEGKADTIKNAKRMLRREEDVVWDMLEEVIKDHPVLLNRAPTLHRMGIQAFQPKLVEGNAIRIHPLVTPGYNADYDGDQMSVHLPLSWEAQIEAHTMLKSTHNILSPAHGNPIATPSQDMVLGAYYMTLPQEGQKEEGKLFSGFEEAIFAYDTDNVKIHTLIDVNVDKDMEVVDENGRTTPEDGFLTTTPGRILFNEILPDELPYYNYALDKGNLNEIIYTCTKRLDKADTVEFLDALKKTTFHASTVSGLTFAVADLLEPKNKQKILNQAEKDVEEIEENYQKGILTPGERFNQIIDTWTQARESVTESLMERLQEDTDDPDTPPNPIHVTTVSGARGSRDQIRQLAGMRGLMARPSGDIIETPIRANFREGLSVLEYFSSTHGARKGLADTALKTADAGYLTRRLVDVSQSVVVRSKDCGTLNGITKSAIHYGDKESIPLRELIRGRCARDTIRDVVTDEIIVEENGLITEDLAEEIEEMAYDAVRVRSPLTCEEPDGVCARCYGMDLNSKEMVEVGMAAGVIAAQSIGEPGTQLTMRTFHIGGTASRDVEESEIRADQGGKIEYHNLEWAENDDGDRVTVNRDAEILILDEKNREVENYVLDPGTVLKVEDEEDIQEGDVLASWDPYNVPIVAEEGGVVDYEDIEKDVTMKEELDPATGISRRIITQHTGEMHPQILLKDDDGEILSVYTIPEEAHVLVDEGEEVTPGTMIAKTPRQMGGTQDITGGLPRVEQLFEARTPDEPAVMAKMDGIVELKGKKRGKRKIMVTDPKTDREAEHLVPPGKHLLVHGGDRVEAGEPLVEGPLDPEEILEIKGVEELAEYLLDEIQSVYRSQGVSINDKHVEIVISQMLRMVKVEDPGDSKFLPGQVVNKFKLAEENQKIAEEGGKPANYNPMLLGITQAALRSDSFISAASFQQTTRVLTEAALASDTDELKGLKENVILGHLIPAGTGFEDYLRNSLHRKTEKEEEEIQVTEEKRTV